MSRPENTKPLSTRKLTHQLWLMLLGPITVALGLYGVAAHQNRQRVLMGEASAGLRNHATLVEAAVGIAAQCGQIEPLKQRIEQLARAARIRGIAAFEFPGGPIFVTTHIAEATPELAALAAQPSLNKGDLEEEREVAGGPALVRTVTFSPQTGAPTVVAIVSALEVEDRGPGVPREIADHIFDAFFTSRGDRGGTGLGLAIVSGIVREAGGTVALVPSTHGGACFRVVLPAETPQQTLDLAEARS